jgi:hypothetical protein
MATHHLCDEHEKALLIEAFELIYQSVTNVPLDKLTFYGKALLGIQDLELIEEWSPYIIVPVASNFLRRGNYESSI